MDDGRWTMDDGRWTMDDGRWTMDDGRWTMDDGRWTIGGGRHSRTQGLVEVLLYNTLKGQGTSGFSGNVRLAMSGLPSKMSGSFSPNPAALPAKGTAIDSRFSI